MKVALVHDWLVSTRGGERVLEAICELFPDADVFTLVHKKGSVPPTIERHRIATSFIDRLPLAQRRHRHFLPLFPFAIERFDFDGYDLIVSSSHCVAKGVRRPARTRHLSYVHAPMRYMYDRFDDYFGPGRAGLAVRIAARLVRPFLVAWDKSSARGVDRFVANSRHIAAQVERLYGRSATVVHPPVDLDRFASAPLEGLGRGGYFLWLGALAPYKRVDVAVEAFRTLGLPLWVVGSGQDTRALKRLPRNVRWLGQVPDRDLPALYRDARAYVFTAEEDFGITPLEAQAAGRPVIALGKGGALETVTPETGLFFSEQTPDGLARAVREFDDFERRFDPTRARANALRFSKATFQERFLAEVRAVMSGEP